MLYINKLNIVLKLNFTLITQQLAHTAVLMKNVSIQQKWAKWVFYIIEFYAKKQIYLRKKKFKFIKTDKVINTSFVVSTSILAISLYTAALSASYLHFCRKVAKLQQLSCLNALCAHLRCLENRKLLRLLPTFLFIEISCALLNALCAHTRFFAKFFLQHFVWTKWLSAISHRFDKIF